MKRTRIFTIGHSDRSLDEFLGLLEHSSIRLVVDVRSNPVSVRFPWFERYALSEALERRGFSYRWMRQLGARVKRHPQAAEQSGVPEEDRDYVAHLNSEAARRAYSEILEIAPSCNLAVMCAERDYERCHRRYIADALCGEGARVVHILDGQTAQEHVLHPSFLQLETGGFVYRDDQLSLFGQKPSGQ